MALIHWRPFQEIETLHRQIDKIFDEVFGSINDSIAALYQPKIELAQTDKDLILRAEILGIDGKDLDVYVAPQAVSIAGKIRDNNKINERSYYTHSHYEFHRIIHLPIPIKNEEVKAEFKNGVLTLILPKLENAKYKVVKLNLADENATLPSSDLPKILDVPVQKA